MDNRIRTLILEDRYIDITGIKRILEPIKEIYIVAECRTVQEGLSKAKELKPEFFIVDGDIYGNKKGGEEFVRKIREIFPNAKILGLTTYFECLDSLRRAGCNHVISKQLIDNQLAADQHIREVLASSENPKPNYYEPPDLSEIEYDALRLIAAGNSDGQIKDRLGLQSTRAAKHIREALMNKFGARKSTEMITLAFKTGILSPKDLFEEE